VRSQQSEGIMTHQPAPHSVSQQKSSLLLALPRPQRGQNPRPGLPTSIMAPLDPVALLFEGSQRPYLCHLDFTGSRTATNESHSLWS
jgi:hypothetical protein